MRTGLAGRRVLVGGATSGIGKAIAYAVAAEGAGVLLWSRDGARLEAAARDLRAVHPVPVAVVAADARDPQAAAVVADRAQSELGGVDVLVLNAGGPAPVAPDQTTADGWRDALQLLTVTPVDLATRLLPGMRAQGFGRVVAVLSSGVKEPIANLAYSNGGRAALTAWLKTVSRAVAADGVTVNGVMPGRIDTPRVASLDQQAAQSQGRPVQDVRRASEQRIPAGRYGRPEEFADLVTFLASDRSGYVTGSVLSCDGGMLAGIL